MRVALVIQKLAGLHGGAERVVIDLAKALSARGYQLTIVTYEPSTGAPGFESEDVPVVNIFPPILRSVVRGRGTRLDNSERFISDHGNSAALARLKWHATHGLFARRLTRWLRRNPHDVIVGFLPPAISAVALAGRALGSERPRVVASTHSVPSIDFGESERWDQNPIARRTNLWALGAADVVTVLQPDFIDELPGDARTHAVVVPNAVQRLPSVAQRGPRNQILGVGRLSELKRYDVLVEAFARIAQEFPAWDLTICGEGDERDRLQAIVERRGLSDRISLPGAVADIGRHYDEARILGHPAVLEGFGLAVAEAILHGLVVIASSSCSGVDRLIEPEVTGLLVAEGDDPVAAFAAALRQLIESPPPEDVREEGEVRLREWLDPERITNQWERILHAY